MDESKLKTLIVVLCLALALLFVHQLVLLFRISSVEKGQEEGQSLEPVLKDLQVEVASLKEGVKKSGDSGEMDSKIRDWSKRLVKLEQDFSELYTELSDRNLDMKHYINRNLDRLEKDIAELRGPRYRTVKDLKEDLKRHGISLDEETETIEVKGAVCQNEALVEFFAVTKRGSTHESVLILDCLPSSLNAAFIAMNYKPGTPAAEANAPGTGLIEQSREGNVEYIKPPEGDKVYIAVEWEAGGEKVRKWAEELILNQATGKPLERAEWLYIGSRMERDQRTGMQFYVPDMTNNIISTWFGFSGTCVLALAESAGASDDYLFANRNLLPEPGTPVKVVFSKIPPKEGGK